jgi:hypothetical protein
MTEAELQELIRDACSWLRLLAYHTRDSRGSSPGFPDLVIVGPGGFLIRELKSETGRITAQQADWLQALRKAGVDAKVWQPVDWHSDMIMNELRRAAGPAAPLVRPA